MSREQRKAGSSRWRRRAATVTVTAVLALVFFALFGRGINVNAYQPQIPCIVTQTHPAKQAMASVVEGRDGTLTAVGWSTTQGKDAAVWRASVHRNQWGEITGENAPERKPRDQSMLSVASFGTGFVAVGRDNDHAAVWKSDDGQAWQQLDLGQADGLHSVMRSIVFTSGKLIAGGWICPKPGAGRQAAIWTSTDGRTWTPPTVLPSPTIDDKKPEAQVNGIESLGSSRLVAVGTVKVESGTLDQGKRTRVDWDAAVWTSENGSQWTPVPAQAIAKANASGFGDQYMSAITEWRGTLIAVGGWGFLQHTRAAVWMSHDGKAWEQTSDEVGQVLAPIFSRSINAVTAVGTTIVAVGYTELLNEKWPQIWRSTDGRHWMSSTDKLSPPRGVGEALAVQPLFGSAAIEVGWRGQHGTQTTGTWRERFDQATSTAPA